MSPSTTSVSPPAAGPARNLKPYESVLDTVGWTPLIRLTRVTRGVRTPVYGKAEFFNPGGSVKDRIGLPIIEQAEREGRLRPGGTIVEGTSGNTGVGLAIAAALKGYKCIFTMPDKMSQEKVRLLKAFGAEVIITPTAVGADHPDNYVMMAKRIAEETPNAILANQFYNQTNPETHYATTGPELWEQTEGRITHFVAAAGTGGTITGVGRYLKEHRPEILVIAVEPARSPVLSGGSRGQHQFQGMGPGFIPDNLDRSILDRVIPVWEEDAFPVARRLAREEGLFVGMSSGAIAFAALQVATALGPGKRVAMIAPDTGARYLSTVLFSADDAPDPSHGVL
jgi:cystathionine beta-synthase